MTFSPHFCYEELTFSEYAARNGIDNTPPPDIIENLIKLSLWLEELRGYAGSPIIVSSGYRCARVNMGIGGSSSSAHMKGFAADITCRNIKPLDLSKLASSAMSSTGYDQIIHEFGQWTHCGLSLVPRTELLTATLVSGKTVYVKGLQ